MERYFCAGCGVTDELNQHGRCAHCGSDAVITSEARPHWAILELERFYKLTQPVR